MSALAWRIAGVALGLVAVVALASPFLTSSAQAQTPAIASTSATSSHLAADFPQVKPFMMFPASGRGLNLGPHLQTQPTPANSPREPEQAVNSLVQQGSTNQSPAHNGGGIGVLATGSVETSPANVRVSALTRRSVPENSVEDVKVGSPIQAGDTGNDPITFSLQGADAAHFKIESIDARSAQLLVGPDAGLDYEVKNVYLVDVAVMDAGGEVSTVNIQVDIEDVRLPGQADEFDVANNHDEHLDREEVEAAHEALQLQSLTRTEMTFIVDYYYSTNFPPIDINNMVSIVDEYDLNEDSIIDRSEVMEALDDYLNGEITKAEMREILKVHFITA